LPGRTHLALIGGSFQLDASLIIGIGVAALFAATFGSMLGLGGGVFLVPILTLFLDIDPRIAVGASAICVVTNSVVGSTVHIRSGFTNLRLAMLLQITTATGAIIGALIALKVNVNAINVVLGLVLIYSAVSMLRQRRTVPPPPAPDAPDKWALRSTYADPATRANVEYIPQRMEAGMAISGGAGILSGMLGIGGGAIQVPLMNLLMKVPVKAAAGTSSFMVGLTAVATAAVFYSHDRSQGCGPRDGGYLHWRQARLPDHPPDANPAPGHRLRRRARLPWDIDDPEGRRHQPDLGEPMQDNAIVTISESEETLRARTQQVLQGGFRLSVVLLVLGLALSLLRRQALPDTLGSPVVIFEGLLDGNGASLVALGILAVIATPFVAAAVIAWSFYQEGDRRYAGIAALVLAILVGSLVVSTF
jgi:uncharacterized membrane protein YfcA/uncharacterized membrane protein